jgi:hypothetical protein
MNKCHCQLYYTQNLGGLVPRTLGTARLGGFGVLCECSGPKDLEWALIYTMRDKEKIRATAAWREQG